MVTREKLVRALRCSATEGWNAKCDTDCPYRLLEEIREDFPIKPDLVVDGVGYWESCDCDQMARDAADMLEQDEIALRAMEERTNQFKKLYEETKNASET